MWATKSPHTTAILRWSTSLLLAALPLAAQTTLRQIYEGIDLTLTPPPARRALEGGNPHLDPALRTLLSSSASRALSDVESSAKGLGIPVRAGRVAVVATARSLAAATALQDHVTRNGGEVVAVLDRAILARVPAPSLEALAADPDLAFLAPQDSPAMTPDPPPSASANAPSRGLLTDGISATRANLLHQKGIRGASVKVGILDFGFTGYRALQARGVVPAPKALRAFGSDGGWDRGNTGVVHGTACAEIIHAMAPDAEIYIASIGDGSGGASADEIVAAALWLASQQVDIISYSGGSHFGAHNGHDLQDKLVEQIVAKGILWIASAGNEGEDHWSTTTRLNSDKLVLTGAKPFLLMLAYGDKMKVEAVWDDWGPDPLNPTSTQDFDIVLNRIDPKTLQTSYVASSLRNQNGAARPLESFSFNSEKGALYALFIVASHVTRSVRFHIFSDGVALYPQNSDGSVGIPAASPKVLAVGAVNVDDAKLETYSSQGPTDDGRDKPDVSAPDRVVSQAYGNKDFTGTSAACPFAAGFAALVMQMRGKLPPAEMVRIITAATTPLSNNSGAGRGLIDAGKLPGVSAPAPGSAPAPAPVSGLQQTLAKLLPLAKDDNLLGVKLVSGHSEYRAGDGLKFGFRAAQPANCLLFRRSPAGQFASVQSDLHLSPGAPVVFPAEENRVIRLSAPGTETAALVCSAQPLNLNSLQQAPPESLSVHAVTYRVR